MFIKETLSEVIKDTVINWGRSTHSNDATLIREMFKLIYNQYDGVHQVKFLRFSAKNQEFFSCCKGFTMSRTNLCYQ